VTEEEGAPSATRTVDDAGVSETLRGIRARLDGLPAARGNNYWLPSFSDGSLRAYVSANRQLLTAAAQDCGLPPGMMAGIAWREVGGAPRLLDDLVYRGRGILPGTDDRDKTSMGPLAVQVRRAAEVLGYDPHHLAGRQRKIVVAAVRDPGQNIFIAAGYLAQLKGESEFAGVPPERMTHAHLEELATRYNGGPFYQVEAAQAYGREFARIVDEAEAALR
jgi:hypothetical protein